MTGNFEVEDQDITDIVDLINEYLEDKDGVNLSNIVARKERLENIKERLLKVDVNEF